MKIIVCVDRLNEKNGALTKDEIDDWFLMYVPDCNWIINELSMMYIP